MKKLLLFMCFMTYIHMLQASDSYSTTKVVCFSDNSCSNDSLSASDVLTEFGENLDEYRHLPNYKDQNRSYVCNVLAWNLYAINNHPEVSEEYKMLCNQVYKNEVELIDQIEVISPDQMEVMSTDSKQQF